MRYFRVRKGLRLSLVGAIVFLGGTAAHGAVFKNDPLFPTGLMGGVYYVDVDPMHPMFYPGADAFELKGKRIVWEGITVAVPTGFTQIDFPDVSATSNAGVDFGADSFFDVFFDVSMAGSMSIRLFDYTPGELGTFSAELDALNLSGLIPLSVPVIGGTPVQIRESPTLASTGETVFQDLGGGYYRIDSFFDIFTELSIDGGTTWIPSSGSTRFAIFPEPSSITITGVAVCAMLAAWRYRRRRAGH